MFGNGQKLVNVPGSVVRRLCNTFVVYWTMIRKHHNTKTGGQLFNAFKGFICLKAPSRWAWRNRWTARNLGVKLFIFCGGETLTKRWVLKYIESLCEGMLNEIM